MGRGKAKGVHVHTEIREDENKKGLYEMESYEGNKEIHLDGLYGYTLLLLTSS